MPPQHSHGPRRAYLNWDLNGNEASLPMTDLSFWQGKRVLVTGGAGFIGSAVVDHLVRECSVPHGDVLVPRSAYRGIAPSSQDRAPPCWLALGF